MISWQDGLMNCRVADYLAQCSIRALQEEEAGVHTPPTPDEARQLIDYLRGKGLKPAVVGSAAVFHHLANTSVKDFRPTVDLDIHVDKKLPPILPGWRRDPEAIGIDSWISPTGGYVDFLAKGHRFVGGGATPSVKVSRSSTAEYPVAEPEDVIRMKLNSMREKDVSDVVTLVKAMGDPTILDRLGRLNRTQAENLVLVKQWVAMAESRKDR